MMELKYWANNPSGTLGTDTTAAAGSPPVATPTQTRGGAAVASPLQYAKQYVSTSKLSSVKSIMVDANGEMLSLLTQIDTNSLGQVSINLTHTCAGTS